MWHNIQAFFINLLEHHLLILVVSVIIIVFSFVWRRYFFEMYKEIHSFPLRINSYLHSNDIKKIAKDIPVSEDQFNAIKKDIDMHIKNLRHGTESQKETAIQYLLEYPTSKGSVAIVQTAVKLNTSASRQGLVCLLCTSMRTKDWYN